MYVRPCDGETLSGDVGFVQPNKNGVFAALIDALGHGPDAHRLGVQLSDALSGWLPQATPPGSPQPVAFALQPADVVILFSDGVAGRFRKDDYPSLGLDPAPEIAFNVVRRFGKGADDASCAVIRCRR